ncbi:MAG: hypothetical protein ACYC3F_13935 [Gemmatimonadaceae bacterium]
MASHAHYGRRRRRASPFHCTGAGIAQLGASFIRGWQTRMNDALRAWLDAEPKRAKRQRARDPKLAQRTRRKRPKLAG